MIPKNIAMNNFNDRLLNVLPGNKHNFKSVDSVVDDCNILNYTVDFF